MLDRLSVLELYETGSGHRMNGLSGRIGDEVEVKPGHNQQTGAIRIILMAM
jgi:hypothetical protein